MIFSRLVEEDLALFRQMATPASRPSRSTSRSLVPLVATAARRARAPGASRDARAYRGGRLDATQSARMIGEAQERLTDDLRVMTE